MVTYEITASVAAEQHTEYEKYMRDRHIPDLLATGHFAGASIGRSQPGRYRVRYEAYSQETLDRYFAKDAAALRQHFQEHFPTGVEVTREEWTVLESWRAA